MLHQFAVAISSIFSPENQFADFFKINQISAEYEPIITSGAKVIRRKLNTSGLKTFGSLELPPLINTKPKIMKLSIRIKIWYFFLVKIMIFSFCTRQKRKVHQE
ncbi:hypothetical protein AQPE_3367 [Aquipluma nitroreducens]|uniref:Uncharacterized protein n=1 Tax=Aquipluma nitroreducens TaxID=2010828 RepID=A0A5K7SC67_9BACT|nr:hypothetical protein AQPE_3367 [Aquipluma nitroreducens]